MADGVVVKHNIPDFRAQMTAFGNDMTRKVFRSGAAAASGVFKKEATARAPVYQGPRRKKRVVGTLKRNIIMVRARDSKAGFEHYVVMPKQGKKPKKGAPAAFMFLPFYGLWVEGGHRKIPRGRAIRGGRQTRALKRQRFDTGGGGRTQPAWFLRDAFNAKKHLALQAAISRVQKRIDKENAKRTPR